MASLRQKQYSVLGMSTLSFAVNFAVWTMFSIIGIRIKDELGLSESVARREIWRGFAQ